MSAQSPPLISRGGNKEGDITPLTRRGGHTQSGGTEGVDAVTLYHSLHGTIIIAIIAIIARSTRSLPLPRPHLPSSHQLDITTQHGTGQGPHITRESQYPPPPSTQWIPSRSQGGYPLPLHRAEEPKSPIRTPLPPLS